MRGRNKYKDMPPPKHGLKLDATSTIVLRGKASALAFASTVSIILLLFLGLYHRNLQLLWNTEVIHFNFSSCVFDIVLLSIVRLLIVWFQACDEHHTHAGALHLWVVSPMIVLFALFKTWYWTTWKNDGTSRALLIVWWSSSFLQLYLSIAIHRRVLKRKTVECLEEGANLLESPLIHSSLVDVHCDEETKENGDKDSSNKNNNKNNNNTAGSLGRLLALAGPEKWLLVCGTIALLLSSGATMIVPALFGSLIRTISSNATASQSDMDQRQSQLNHISILLVIFFALTSVFTFLRGTLFTLAGERVVARFRKRLFAALSRADITFFDRTQSGELVNRLASDSSVIQNAVTVNVSMALRFVGQFVVGMILLFVLSPSLTGIMLSCVPAVVCGAVAYGRFVRKIGKSYQKSLADAGEVASEVLGNIRTVRSFAKEASELHRYAISIDESFSHGKRRAFAYGAFAGGIGLFAYSAVVLVLWYGGSLVIHGNGMDAGTLITFLLYTIYIAGALGGLSSLYGNLMNAVGASERMFELLDQVPDINTMEGSGIIPQDDTSHIARIEFDRVTFAYETRKDVPVLCDVSFICDRGQTVALVGPSGAGKSTVVSLIQRFYDPNVGSIRLGGNKDGNVQSYRLDELDPVWLKSKMALVAQEPVLFGCSIRQNIIYGVRENQQMCSIEQVESAARQANAHDFIMEFKDGYDTQVGERGVQLSGGQKQRIAIARAILLDPDILLLDEATSALDAESEAVVQDALNKLMQHRTTLVIAHRLSTVRDADLVLVMDHGAIAERGTHEELLTKPEGLYRYLVKRQLTTN